MSTVNHCWNVEIIFMCVLQMSNRCISTYCPLEIPRYIHCLPFLQSSFLLFFIRLHAHALSWPLKVFSQFYILSCDILRFLSRSHILVGVIFLIMIMKQHCVYIEVIFKVREYKNDTILLSTF